MDRVLKVFATGEERQALSNDFPPLVEYDAFVIVQASKLKAKALAKEHLIEDITDQYAIPLETKTVETAPRFVKGKPRTTAAQGIKSPDDKRHHYLVQFIGPVKAEWIKGIRRIGGEPREPYEGFTYLVRANKETLDRIRVLPYVRWVGHLPHNQRIERTALASSANEEATLPRTKTLPGAFVVEFFGPNDAKKAKREVKSIGFEILSEDTKNGRLTIHTDATKVKQKSMVQALSAVHGVRKVRERTLDRPSNDVALGIMNAAASVNPSGVGLDGAGEVVAVCDTGLDTGDLATIHDDFKGRVTLLKSYAITAELDPFLHNPRGNDGAADLDSGHGTHVAGSVLGDGTISLGINGQTKPIRGLAPKAKLVFQAVEQETKWKNPSDLAELGRFGLWGIPQDLKTLFKDAYQANARIHSNSWGGGKPGEYDDQCRQLDEFVWEKKDLLVLVAAGNDGTDRDGDGKINPMSVTSPGTAKNCLTVGASESKRSQFSADRYGAWWPQDYPEAPFKNDPMANNEAHIAAFSSRGPTKDGRVKPEIVAPGTFILSARSTQIAPNNKGWAAFPPSKKYFYMGGTSMATPLVAGAAALLRQYLKSKHGITKPSAALLKAALIAGVQRLSGLAPAKAVHDNHQGFGRVDLDAVIAPTSSVKAQFIENTTGLATGQLKAHPIHVSSSTMPLRVVLVYTDFPGPKLVNNLNLILTSPNGKKHVGNQTSTGGVVQFDAVNNVEVITVGSPTPGSWKIEVIASNVPRGPQDYALTILGRI